MDPLDESQFFPALRLALEEGRSGTKPVLSQHNVYRKIMKVTKSNSSVPGDVPIPLMKRYPFQYASPATKIFKEIIKSGRWPRQWVKEETIV